MAWKTYQEDCPGCRPAMIDLKTGQPLPDDNPMMKIVLGLFSEASYGERQAFHNVTCNNSRRTKDLQCCRGLVARFQKAIDP